MYGLTRATLTLIGVAAAGLLLWLATEVFNVAEGNDTARRFWAACGLLAAAGLAIALSQILGGWTKWGLPTVSGGVFLIGFLPALVAGGWVLAAASPGGGWLPDHVRNWSGDLSIDGIVSDLESVFPAIAFGIGLVFGLTFDTSGPRVAPADAEPPTVTAPPRRETEPPVEPAPEAPPRAGEPTRESPTTPPPR